MDRRQSHVLVGAVTFAAATVLWLSLRRVFRRRSGD